MGNGEPLDGIMAQSKPSLDELNTLAAQKERELQEVSEQRIGVLLKSLRDAEEMVQKERMRFLKLKTDFEYNVQLIKERDRELDHYESVTLRHRRALVDREQEVSDLKIKVADINTKLSQMESEKVDLSNHYNQRMRELEKKTNSFQATKQAEVDQERDNYQKWKKEMETKLCEAKEEMESQRRQMLLEFEEAMKKKEHHHKIELDEEHTKFHALELQNRMLEREKELLKESSITHNSQVEVIETEVQEMKRSLKQKEWDLQDLKNLKDAQLAEQKEKLQELQREIARTKADSMAKLAESSKRLTEKESSFRSLKDTSETKIKELTDVIHSLKLEIDQCKTSHSTQEWNFADKMKAKDIALARLREQLEDTCRKMTVDNESSSREIVAKDVQLESLRDMNCKMTEDIQTRDQDLNRYKRDFSMALERERVLEQAKVQLELDWRKRCEEVERKAYASQEQLVVSLTRSKDELVAQLSNVRRQLQQQQEMASILKSERDRMQEGFRKKSLSLDGQGGEILQTELDELRTENATLKTVIRQMRTDMETLSKELASSGRNNSIGTAQDETAGSPVAPKETLAQLTAKLLQRDQALSQHKAALNVAKQEFTRMQRNWSIQKLKLTKKIDDLESERDARLLTEKALRSSDAHVRDEVKANDVELPHALDSSSSSKVRRLQAQLRNAVKQIATLGKERQQLIQLASKQRSQLVRMSDARSLSTQSAVENVPQEPKLTRNGELKEPRGTSDVDLVLVGGLQQYEIATDLKSTLESWSTIHGDLPTRETEQIHGETVEDNVSLGTESVVVAADDVSLQPLPLSSSSNVESLGEIWKLLDQPLSEPTTPKIAKSPEKVVAGDLTSVEPGNRSTRDRLGLLLKGSQPPMVTKHSLPAKQFQKFGVQPPKARQRKSIRNYNIKDDSDIR